MAALLIDSDSSLDVLLEHNTFSCTKIAANPLTAALAPEYEAFQVKWLQVNTKEILLWVDTLRAAAKVAVADDTLDILVDKISNAVLVITGNKTDADLYILFFKGKPPSVHKKPVLGNQLETMRAWVGHLKTSSHASLQALGAELEIAVAHADQAVLDVAKAKSATHQFRTVGERRALVDEFNAMQKRNSGKIAEIPHTDAGKGLPNTFHEAFFKKSSRSAPANAEEKMKTWTSADYVAAIAESEGKTDDLKAKLAEALKAEQEAEEKKKTLEAKKAARDEKLAAFNKAKEELEAAEKDLI